MPRRKRAKRVVILIADPGDAEIRIARGVVEYYLKNRDWQFATGALRPYKQFSRIDLKAVDGIVGNFMQSQWAEAVIAAGIQAVNTSNRIEDLPLARVAADEEAIGRAAGEHLLERGLANLAFVPPSNVDSWFARRRLAGFRQVVEQVAHRQVHVFHPDVGGVATDSGAIVRWLKGLPKPLGLFAAVDEQAFWTVTKAVEAGLRVPHDIAVIGVDNHEWASAASRVPLTSVDADLRTIGFQAAEVLNQLMNGNPVPAPKWITPRGVVARQSTDIAIQQDKLVADALSFIREHLASQINVEDVLYELGVSRTTLEKRMKQAIGLTPHAAICRERVRCAKQMLLETRATMDEISRACGFREQPHFNCVFKRVTGMTPGEFRL
jgi:LacI family transcriptional regulator